MDDISKDLAILATDPWLEPYKHHIVNRVARFRETLDKITSREGLLGPISLGHKYFGFNLGEHKRKKGIWYREWAPAAHALYLFGDFNGWNRDEIPLTKDEFGVWSIFLPNTRKGSAIPHESLLKVRVISAKGDQDRIPAYIVRAIQDPLTMDFSGQYWQPKKQYQFMSPVPIKSGREGLRIYECHVGMAVEEERVGTFKEFKEHIIPRAQRLGYNAIQLMAIIEHPYYGSLGYHVSSLYGVSSRFGTPEELKELVDAAHGAGLLVLLDIVHSHVVKNLREGLNEFDGTQYQYFHDGDRGLHVAWDSMLFDYSKYEVKRFLLSNVRYWLEEYRFDGFRFDGVTSMLYKDHGLSRTFSRYDDYFDDNLDTDAVVYLQLANELAHQVNPNAITIAEDVSGMPGIGTPVSDGGIGFDYRLSMGIPDYWIKILKERRDEDWSLQEIYSTLLNRRHGEKHVGYAESHDQALVGDKTLAFHLMDQEMYWNMAKDRPSPVVDRGIALHKLIRLLTFSLGGEGYLTFFGNEFGHPEWIDFPREGNRFSYKYARRQWSLSENEILRYKGLECFEKAMLSLDINFNLLTDPFIEQPLIHENEKQLAYRRGPLVFIFNFHPTQSYSDLRIPVPEATDYALLLDSDSETFEGHGRIMSNFTYPVQETPMYGRTNSIQIYLPQRTAQVLAPVRLIG